MKFEKDTRNELFKRQEISFELEADKNPSFSEIRSKIAEQTGKPEESIDVLNINGNFGSNIFNIDAYVYDSKEDLEKAQQKTQKQRKAEAETTNKPVEQTSSTESDTKDITKQEASEPEKANPDKESKIETIPAEEPKEEENPAEEENKEN